MRSGIPQGGHLYRRNGATLRKRRSTRPRKGVAPWLETTVVQCAWTASRKKASYRRCPKKAICAVAASILTAAYPWAGSGESESVPIPLAFPLTQYRSRGRLHQDGMWRHPNRLRDNVLSLILVYSLAFVLISCMSLLMRRSFGQGRRRSGYETSEKVPSNAHFGLQRTLVGP